MKNISILNNKYNNFLIIFILALLYLFAGITSLLLLKDHNNIVNIGIFASEGISLAFALYFGKRVWPGIFLGQLILALINNIDLLSSFEIASINSIEAIIGVTLFNKYKLDMRLLRLKDIIGLSIIIIFILQVFSSFLSNIVLLLNEQIIQEEFITSTFSWWFGNIMGQLLFTPFILSILMNYKNIKILHYIFCGLVFGILLYFIEIVFVIKSHLLILSITIPFTIFVVSRKGITYGMLLSVIVAFISSYSVYLNVGAFYLESNIDNIINYNLFVLAHIIIVFTVNILFEQKKKFELNLRKTLKVEINKNKEQQLLMIQQSRLAQMGEMIAMIAHQWRQPLNNLSLANQLIVSKYNKKSLDDKSMNFFKENSKKQIELMSRTIDDFRNFFKSEKIMYKFCVNEIIENILNIVKTIYITNNIKINFDIEKKYYSFGYPNELGQAILNIINNAKDALIDSEKDDKYINITITKEHKNIVISISDNAGGIPNDIIDKIFDPYFSTKNNKNGTGLGLYMTKMIIHEKLKAKLSVTNENDGANFKIYLKEDEQ